MTANGAETTDESTDPPVREMGGRPEAAAALTTLSGVELYRSDPEHELYEMIEKVRTTPGVDRVLVEVSPDDARAAMQGGSDVRVGCALVGLVFTGLGPSADRHDQALAFKYDPETARAELVAWGVGGDPLEGVVER